MNQTIAAEFRANLKLLLQGFVEHCEISHRLVGQIEQPIYFHGQKFGSPVFTFQGDEIEPVSLRRIGLIGHNRRDNKIASEVVLQLIELAIQRPAYLAGQTARALPVSDPVALELGLDAPDLADWEVLQHALNQFRDSAHDGLLEISTHSGSEIIIHGSADSALFQSLSSNVTVKRDLQTLPLLTQLRLIESGPWHLHLHVPQHWAGSGEVLAVSRFIARVLEAAAHLACPAPVKLSA